MRVQLDHKVFDFFIFEYLVFFNRKTFKKSVKKKFFFQYSICLFFHVFITYYCFFLIMNRKNQNIWHFPFKKVIFKDGNMTTACNKCLEWELEFWM